MAETLTRLTWPAPHARPAAPVRDAMTLIGRALRLSRRNAEALITSLMLPVMLLLMFVYLFGGAIRVDTSYATYVVPGVILVCAAFGSSTTAVVVSERPVEPGELREFAARGLASYKVPKRVEFVEALPRNAMGKLVRGDI